MKYAGLNGVRIATDRDRVLLVGANGTKKTSSILDIALMYPGVGVAIIDTDDGVNKLVNAQYGGWDSFPNVIRYPAHNWESFALAYGELKGALERGDWLAIDAVGDVRKWAIAHVTALKHEQDKLEMKLKALEEHKKVMFGGLEGVDWDTVNLLLEDTLYHAFKRLPCNLLFVAPAKPLTLDKDSQPVFDKGIPTQWKALAVKPECDWITIGKMDTVLYLESKASEAKGTVEFSFRTIGKDRNTIGEHVTKGVFTNLWSDYCTKVGKDASKSPGT